MDALIHARERQGDSYKGVGELIVNGAQNSHRTITGKCHLLLRGKNENLRGSTIK